MSDSRIQYDLLLAKVTRKLVESGMDEVISKIAAESICTASLRGTDSHGVRLLPHYLQAIASGRINKSPKSKLDRTGSSTARFDADHMIGHAAVAIAMDHAIEIAKETGVGFVSIYNSTHCGAMAYYGLRAANKDMIGLAFTNATAKVKVHDASQTYFGINPICFTAPMEGEGPFCYDSAPTVMSNNKVKIYKEQNIPLPEGVAADSNGMMTLDADKARMLLPLGGQLSGYKGYGLAMLVDILCSLLGGMPSGKRVTTMYESDGGKIGDKRYLAQFVGAIDISRFQDIAKFKSELTRNANEVREMGENAMIPGDPEKRAETRNLEIGIVVSEKVLNLI